jgi:DNA-3-methyladenine glycosylase
MKRRRGKVMPSRLVDGPAKLCQAFAIDGRLNGHDLCASAARLFLEADPRAPRGKVTRGPRVGLNTVPEPWKSKPWRFRLMPAPPTSSKFAPRAPRSG